MRQNTDINPDYQCQNQISAYYYSPYSFNDLKKVSENSSFSIIHNNVGSLQLHLLNESSHNFYIIGISETKIHSSMQPTLNLNIPGTILNKFQHLFCSVVLECTLVIS